MSPSPRFLLVLGVLAVAVVVFSSFIAAPFPAALAHNRFRRSASYKSLNGINASEEGKKFGKCSFLGYLNLET